MATCENDHNQVCRGKCTLCTCLGYRIKEGSNACGQCQCPSSKHEVKLGCRGSDGCSCKAFTYVKGTSDCYCCGHDARLHIGLKRTSVKSSPTTNSTGVNDFRELTEHNKKKRAEYVERLATKGASEKKNKKTEGNGARYRRTIKLQLKRPKFKSAKKLFVPVGDQRQVLFNKTTTLQNVLRACAKEYLNIEDNESFQSVVELQGLEIFLLDGKAVVTDESFTHNKTTFHFCYTKKSERSYGNIASSDSNDSISSHPNTEATSNDVSSVVATKQSNPSTSVVNSLHEEIDITGNMTLEDVLSCGKSIAYLSPKREGEIFRISTFDIKNKEWCYLGQMRINIEGEEINRGGMRKAMKGVVVKGSNHPMLRQFRDRSIIVAKCYLDNVIAAVQEKGRGLVSIARKEIQTQMVVRYIANEFAKRYAGQIEHFPRVVPAFIATTEDGEDVYMLEEWLDGEFMKYMNNDGTVSAFASSCFAGRVCTAFAHWSLSFGEGRILVTDLQGVDLQLTDVELATTEKGYFGIGNVGTEALSTFRTAHRCNDICQQLKLHQTYPLTQENQAKKSKFSV